MIELKMLVKMTGGALRPVRDKQSDRNKEAGLCLQRTVRQVIGVRAAAIKVSAGQYIYLRGAEVGEPTHLRSGKAKRNVGYDRTTGQGVTGARISVSVYGYEASGRHPGLRLTYDRSRHILGRVMSGAAGAPRFADLSATPPKQPSISATRNGLRDAWKRAESLGLTKPRKRSARYDTDPRARSEYARKAALARWRKS